MGLVVLALRVYYIFSNLYYSFKILKLPLPSSRNNGQPSVRALTQRKRDMKGCLTIWIVWCCMALYETHVEHIVSIFIPFYDEIKSVILLMLILSRARGAEPIYLHIIRPLIKPYAPLVDPILEVVLSVGDFILLVISLPFSPIISWWRRRSSKKIKNKDGDKDQSQNRSTTYDSKALKPPTNTRAEPPETLTNQNNHQIWHPPASSYEDDDGPPAYAASTGPPPPMPVPQPYIPSTLNHTDTDSLDWRSYPPFPAAYPPTPLPPTKMPVPNHVRTVKPQFYAINENGNGHGTNNQVREDYDADTSSEQDFRMSLLPPREPSNPGSDGSLSDDMNMQGVQQTDDPSTIASTSTFSEDDAGDDDDYIDEEDSFDITLRTPRPIRVSRPSKHNTPRTRNILSSLTPKRKTDGRAAHTSMLTTPPQAQLGKGSSTLILDSSVVGRKRARPVRSPAKAVRSPRKTGRITVITRSTSASSSSSKTRPSRIKTVKKPKYILTELDEDSIMDLSDEEEEEQKLEDEIDDSEDSADSSHAVISKRRRVIRAPGLSPPRKRTPLARTSSKDRTVNQSVRHKLPPVAATRTSTMRAARVRSSGDNISDRLSATTKTKTSNLSGTKISREA